MKKVFNFSYIALVLAFIYVPILILVIFSFNSGTTIGVWHGFSFKWYGELGSIGDVVLFTVILALVSSLISTLLGTLGAVGIYYSRRRRYGKIINGISQIPVVNSEIVTASALVMAFMLLGLSHRSLFALFVGHVILSAPFVVLSVMPKLKQMDNNLYEAALDLGASPFKAFMKVIVPEILPGILSGFMLAITLSLDDYIVTATLSPLEYDTISTAVYKAIAHTTEMSGERVAVFRALTTIIFLLTLTVVFVNNLRPSKKNKEKK
ncbi:MAG: ABC transporter permease [Clostridia bacterium]|nr:ABC transporter permease [Clostridia bacterium]